MPVKPVHLDPPTTESISAFVGDRQLRIPAISLVESENCDDYPTF